MALKVKVGKLELLNEIPTENVEIEADTSKLCIAQNTGNSWLPNVDVPQISVTKSPVITHNRFQPLAYVNKAVEQGNDVDDRKDAGKNIILPNTPIGIPVQNTISSRQTNVTTPRQPVPAIASNSRPIGTFCKKYQSANSDCSRYEVLCGCAHAKGIDSLRQHV